MKMIMIALITTCIIISSEFQKQTPHGWGCIEDGGREVGKGQIMRHAGQEGQ